MQSFVNYVTCNVSTPEAYIMYIHPGLKFLTISVLLLDTIVSKQEVLLSSNQAILGHLKAINEYILVKRIVGARY